jgi:phage terminase small subunit
MSGSKPRSSTATKLGQRPDIRARVAELIDQWSDDLSLSLERVLQELSRVAFSDIRRVIQWSGGKYQKIVTIDAQGAEIVEFIQRQAPVAQLVDSTSLDAATAAAIQEVTQTKDGTIRVRMHPKLQALQQLASHFEPLATGDRAKVIPQVNPLADPARPLDFKRLNEEFSLPLSTVEPEKPHPI